MKFCVSFGARARDFNESRFWWFVNLHWEITLFLLEISRQETSFGVSILFYFLFPFFLCVINLMESLTRGCQFSFIFHFPFFVINLTSIEQNLTATSVVKANFQGRHLAGDRLPSGCWFDPLIHVECLRVSYWSVGGGKASMH